MWKCNSCGASNGDESDVCSSCGAQKPLETAAESAPKSNGMKVLIAVLAVACVLLIGVIVYLSSQKKTAAVENAAPIESVTAGTPSSSFFSFSRMFSTLRQTRSFNPSFIFIMTTTNSSPPRR